MGHAISDKVNLLLTKLPRSSNELKLMVLRRAVYPSATFGADLPLFRFYTFISALATQNPHWAITADAVSET